MKIDFKTGLIILLTILLCASVWAYGIEKDEDYELKKKIYYLELEIEFLENYNEDLLEGYFTLINYSRIN